MLDENRSWMEPAALDPAGMAVLCFQSYVVKTPHHTILVDACIGNDKSFPHRPTWHRKSDSNWMQALKAAGVTVDDIDIVMCTHLHGDHVGWNTRLENGRWVPTFPNAKYLFSKKEYEYWDGVHRETPLDPMRDSVLPIIDAKKAELVTSDYAVDDHIRLTPTPGHTPDHFAVCAGRGGDQAVFTGDLIHSPIQARYPDLVMRVDYDQKQASATRRAFLERYCDTSTLCCTMHFPSPSVGHIRRWGDGFRCEPISRLGSYTHRDMAAGAHRPWGGSGTLGRVSAGRAQHRKEEWRRPHLDGPLDLEAVPLVEANIGRVGGFRDKPQRDPGRTGEEFHSAAPRHSLCVGGPDRRRSAAGTSELRSDGSGPSRRRPRSAQLPVLPANSPRAPHGPAQYPAAATAPPPHNCRPGARYPEQTHRRQMHV